MTALLVQKAARDSLSDIQREALRHAGQRVSLGEPAEYVDGEGTAWLVYDDGRFTLLDAAVGGRILALAGSFPDFDPRGKSRAEIHDEDVRFAAENSMTRPEDVDGIEDAKNPWQAVLDAQGAPTAIRMVDQLPDDFSPVRGAE